MKTFIVPATLTIIALMVAIISNKIAISELQSRVTNLNVYKAPNIYEQVYTVNPALEERIKKLEATSLPPPPFFRDVTVEESQLIFEYTLAVRQIQDGGFKLSHIVQGTHGISVYFTKGNETLSKIIMLKK